MSIDSGKDTLVQFLIRRNVHSDNALLGVAHTTAVRARSWRLYSTITATHYGPVDA